MPEKNVHILNHPLIQHKLTVLRRKETSTAKFRAVMKETAMLMGYEVTRDLPLALASIETPLEIMQSPIIAGKNLALICILRAGQGLTEGILQLLPTAKVGHLGLYHDRATQAVVEYYNRLPSDIHRRQVLVLDPMLATGETAVIAVNRLKEAKPLSIAFLCLLSAPEGLKYFHEHHPDVPIYTAGIDRELNSNNYILPGLGDAGDRLFGTL